MRRVSPFFVPRILGNMASGNVSIAHGLAGPNLAPATACAAGAHAVGEAALAVRLGLADRMLAGGTEAAIHPLSMVGFARAKALATSFNDTPQQASRPFDARREGFVMGEGAGILLLEEYELAKSRGARIYGEVVGFGMTGDAFHITQSSGVGAARAMRIALKEAGVAPAEVGYVNAHATSTPLGDAQENSTIKEVFAGSTGLRVSSTKGATGHLLGAAGAVEALFTLLALDSGICPPTLNFNPLTAEPDMTLNYVPNLPQAVDLKYAMSNSFGFGGTNAVLLFKRV